jgi:hypothetical protein
VVAKENLLKTNDNITEIVGDTIAKGGITGTDLGAAWYAIMLINANNKYILHSLEEAKLQQALLGTELHIKSSNKIDELNSFIVGLKGSEY